MCEKVILKKCICGCSLRSGIFFIAIFNMIVHGILTYVFLYMAIFAYSNNFFVWLVEKLLYPDVSIKGFLFTNAALSFLITIVCTDLLYGAIKKKMWHLVPYIVVTFFLIGIRIFMIFWCLFSNSAILWRCIVTSFDIICFLHVLSYYFQLADMPTESSSSTNV
ncbi:uncharacterized protein LOC120354172 isoform X1 [Nilaparvata lugens]|uniref:uncharacterized protein LOC120354172 isoform X1 n=1 Tax=Nilaparvata lugens TaxID=108931 RepID=UPI00193E5A80|nr:uncharacterized protein LOC120354172 isoform X1 [Nilaparvata lugens]